MFVAAGGDSGDQNQTIIIYRTLCLFGEIKHSSANLIQVNFVVTEGPDWTFIMKNYPSIFQLALAEVAREAIIKALEITGGISPRQPGCWTSAGLLWIKSWER